MKITKALIPAAGLGTRFLPITKSVPKEMLPILNLPALHYIIREGIASGIDQFSIIISPEKKQVIQDYFAQDEHLDTLLKKGNRYGLIEELNAFINQCTFSYPIQAEPKGLGHAILCGKQSIGDSFFAVFLPDDIIYHPKTPALAQLVKVAKEHNATVIAVQEVPRQAVSSYGIIAPGKQIDTQTWQITDMVEKPAIADAPSSLAIIGRYLFSPILFEYLAQTKPGKGGEIQLTDAIKAMVHDGHPVLAYQCDGERFDLGTPVGWLEANTFFEGLE